MKTKLVVLSATDHVKLQKAINEQDTAMGESWEHDSVSVSMQSNNGYGGNAQVIVAVIYRRIS